MKPTNTKLSMTLSKHSFSYLHLLFFHMHFPPRSILDAAKTSINFSSQSIHLYLKQLEAEVSIFHAGSVFFLPSPGCWIQPLPQQWGKAVWGLKDLHLPSRLGFYELSCLPWQMGMGTHLQGWHGFPLHPSERGLTLSDSKPSPPLPFALLICKSEHPQHKPFCEDFCSRSFSACLQMVKVIVLRPLEPPKYHRIAVWTKMWM